MGTLEKYTKYRELQVELHTKLLDKYVQRSDFYKAAEMLGIVEQGDVVFETEYEKEIVFDFTLYEKIRNGKSVISECLAEGQEISMEEKDLLMAMEKADGSLYEVVGIDKEIGSIVLKDVLGNTEDVRIIDRGLSVSLNENILIYTRPVHLEEFSMTTGIGFVFSKNHKQYLIQRSRKMMKKINSGDASVNQFIAFFKLNRTDGLPIMFG